MDIRITSFGHLHGPRPADAHIVLDLRQHFRDPHFDPILRTLTACDRRVIRVVKRTPGIEQLLAATVAQAQAYARGPGVGQHPLHIAVGCAGGRHRGVDRTTRGHTWRERIVADQSVVVCRQRRSIHRSQTSGHGHRDEVRSGRQAPQQHRRCS